MPRGTLTPIISRRKWRHERTSERGIRAVLEDPLRAVDVLQEQIQRDDALRQAALDAVPLRARQDARDEVEGEQPLGAEAVAVDGEGDALEQEREVGQAPALLELRRRHLRQLVEERHAVRPRLAAAGEHLVVERSGIVVAEQRSTDGIVAL